jgi:hypothetical protein
MSEPSDYVVEHIRAALAAEVGELGVHVDLTTAGVFLTGDVATPERRDAVGAAVQRVVPDRPVHNQMVVQDYPAPATAEDIA